MTYIEQALREYNLDLPPWKPFYRIEQLTPADQSWLEVRAKELQEAYDTRNDVAHPILVAGLSSNPSTGASVSTSRRSLDDPRYYRPRSLQVRRS